MKTYATEHESILKEAERLTHGDRARDYGHPHDVYSRVAGMTNALLHDKLSNGLTAADIAMIMVCLKLCRERVRSKRDNRTDLAGFAWVLDRIQEQESHEYAEAMREANELVQVPVGTSERELLDIPHFLRQDESSPFPTYGGPVKAGELVTSRGKTIAEEEFPLFDDLSIRIQEENAG